MKLMHRVNTVADTMAIIGGIGGMPPMKKFEAECFAPPPHIKVVGHLILGTFLSEFYGFMDSVHTLYIGYNTDRLALAPPPLNCIASMPLQY